MKNIKEDGKLNVLNHSCAHLLAQAVKHLYPNAKFWVGPVIEEGFYYDIDLGEEVIKEEDLPKLEQEMKKISKDGKRIVRHEISKSEALEMFKEDPYKIDLINNMPDGEVISCYTQGDFTDLCRGPHVETVKELKYLFITHYHSDHIGNAPTIINKYKPKFIVYKEGIDFDRLPQVETEWDTKGYFERMIKACKDNAELYIVIGSSASNTTFAPFTEENGCK